MNVYDYIVVFSITRLNSNLCYILKASREDTAISEGIWARLTINGLESKTAAVDLVSTSSKQMLGSMG